MKKFLLLFTLLAVMAGAATAQKVARAYGVRVWSDPEATPAIVSFPVDNPSQIIKEVDLSNYISIRAAACDGENYYLLTSADGMLPSELVAVDIHSKKVTTVKTYDYKLDPIGSYVIQDIDFNPADGKLYGVGFDLESAEIVDGSIEFNSLAMFTIDTATGETTEVGSQSVVVISAITFSKEGDMFGIDDTGALWTLNTANGKPMDPLCDTGISPVGTQSMATDLSTGAMYWASFSQSGVDGVSKLIRFDHTDDWVFTVTDLGNVANTTELVGLYIDPDPISSSAPATPTGLTVTPAPAGGNTAEISWTAPTATRAGQQLETVDIAVYVDGETVKTLTGEKAGSKGSYTYTAPSAKLFTISVSAIANGEESEQAYADAVFIGTDRPGTVTGLTAVRPDKSKYDITVSWEKPATGMDGGWYDESQLTYRIVRLPDNKVIAEAATYTSFTDSDITASGAYIYQITPSTTAGVGPTAESAPCLSGPAVQLPYVMDLTNQADADMWTVVNGDNDQYLWSILRNWGGNDTSFRYYPEALVGGQIATDDWLISPAFAMETGKYYAMSYDVRLWGDLFPATYTINMGRDTTTPAHLTTTLASYSDDIIDLEWVKRSTVFTVSETGDYNIGFGVLLANPIEIKGVTLREICKVDILATEISGITSVGLNEKAIYSITVVNDGFDPVSNFEVSLVDKDGKVLASTKVTEILAPQTSATYQIDWTPDTEGTYELYGKATVENDGNTANDLTSPLTVNVQSARWYDITDGKSMTGYAPFYLQYNYSGAQTIYSATEMGGKPATLSGIIYTYFVMSGTPRPIHAKIAMANTTVADFDRSFPLEKSEFQTVYEGDIIFDAKKKSVTIMFDTPFEYTGGNLCIQTENSTDGPSSLLFDSKSASANVTALYRSDTAPYDFTDNAGIFHDRPNISLFMSESTTGLTGIGCDTTGIRYDRSTRRVLLDTPDTVSVYSMQGILLHRSEGTEIDLSTLTGPALITTASGKTLKIIL